MCGTLCLPLLCADVGRMEPYISFSHTVPPSINYCFTDYIAICYVLDFRTDSPVGDKVK